VVRVELDEALARGDRGSPLVVLPVRVRHLELRLLRVAAVRVARFQLLEVLDRLLPLLVGHRVLRLAVQALRRPAGGLVRGHAAAARGEHEQGKQEGND